VASRFGIPSPQQTTSLSHSYPGTTAQAPQQVALRISDIRSLKEAKAPKSANEMAALVAYYVSELAPADQRTKQINKADIERYFKQQASDSQLTPRLHLSMQKTPATSIPLAPGDTP
jgi:hypothetical protein